MSPSAKLVPTWVRIVSGVVALLNLAFGLSGYFNPTGIFSGLTSRTPEILNAAYNFSARNTAIAIALIIVSLVGVPESIAIVMIIRFLVEGQDLAISILAGASLPAFLMPLAFMVVEAVIIVSMFRLANALHSKTA
jgi:hypothetical protein